MFEKLMEKLGLRREPLSDEELAEQETIRRQAEEERRRAEADLAQQRQHIDSGGGSWGGY